MSIIKHDTIRTPFSPTESSFSQLSDVLIHVLLPKLDLKDLMQLRQVSKAFFRFVSSCLFKSAKMFVNYQTKSSDFFLAMTRLYAISGLSFVREVTRLAIPSTHIGGMHHQCSFDSLVELSVIPENDPVTLPIHLKLYTKMPRLQNITFIENPEDNKQRDLSIYFLLRLPKTVSTLKLSLPITQRHPDVFRINESLNEELWRASLSNIKTLHLIKWIESDLDYFSTRLPNLEHLRLDKHRKGRVAPTFRFLNNMTHLTTLEIYQIFGVETSYQSLCLPATLRSFTCFEAHIEEQIIFNEGLQHLNLFIVKTGQSGDAVFQAPSTVKHMNIALTNARHFARFIAKVDPNCLETLSLSAQYFLSNTSFEANETVTSWLPTLLRLTTLKLTSFKQLSHLKLPPHLENLSLDRCSVRQGIDWNGTKLQRLECRSMHTLSDKKILQLEGLDLSQLRHVTFSCCTGYYSAACYEETFLPRVIRGAHQLQSLCLISVLELPKSLFPKGSLSKKALEAHTVTVNTGRLMVNLKACTFKKEHLLIGLVTAAKN